MEDFRLLAAYKWIFFRSESGKGMGRRGYYRKIRIFLGGHPLYYLQNGLKALLVGFVIRINHLEDFIKISILIRNF